MRLWIAPCLLLMGLLLLLAACDAGSDAQRNATAPAKPESEANASTGPNLERFVGLWELVELLDDEGEPWEENGALWSEMVLHEDGRFEARTQWISDEPFDKADFRDAALFSVVSDRIGVRIESRGLWTAVWDGDAGKLTLSLRFDRRGSHHNEARSTDSNDSADKEDERDLTLRAELVGQGGSFMRLAGHPVHRGIAETLHQRSD